MIQSFSLPDSQASAPDGWGAHRIALQILVSRAVGGEREAGEVLWKAIGGDPQRILVLDETLERVPGAPEVAALRDCGKPWATWFDELAARAKAGKLPDAFRKHRNRERCLNIFRHFGPPFADYMNEKWQKDTLLPAVIQAENNGKLPDAGVTRDNLTYAFARLAQYATGKPGVGRSLANDPLVSESFGSGGKSFENLAYQLFTARRDPVWKTKIINVLQSASWLPDEPIEYAQALGDKEVDAAVEERVSRLRNTEASEGDKMMSLYEIKHVEERVRNAKMAELPVR